MDNNTMRIRLYKSRILTSGFRCGETEREYSVLWPKWPQGVVFSREWCYDARKAIQAENSRLFDETGRCSWSSGDYVSMPSKYYNNEDNK